MDKVLMEKAIQAYRTAKSLEQGKQLFCEWMDADAALRERVLVAVRDTFVDELIRAACRTLRRKLGDYSEHEASTAGLAAMGQSMAAGFYDFPLPLNGKPLGDATRAEVEAARVFYLKQAAGNHRQAAWMELVVRRMRGKGAAVTVRAALSAGELKRLHRQASKPSALSRQVARARRTDGREARP